MQCASGTFPYRRSPAEEPFARIIFAPIGYTTALTGESGQITDSYATTPFGASFVSATNVAVNPFIFMGQRGVHTESNGLLAARARYFSTATNRFISLDQIAGNIYAPQTIARYNFASGNPLTFVDPTGLYAEAGKYTYDKRSGACETPWRSEGKCPYSEFDFSVLSIEWAKGNFAAAGPSLTTSVQAEYTSVINRMKETRSVCQSAETFRAKKRSLGVPGGGDVKAFATALKLTQAIAKSANKKFVFIVNLFDKLSTGVSFAEAAQSKNVDKIVAETMKIALGLVAAEAALGLEFLEPELERNLERSTNQFAEYCDGQAYKLEKLENELLELRQSSEVTR